jgi:RHS repeat-associated protein
MTLSGCPSETTVVNKATNRTTWMTYDAAGRVKTDGTYAMTWDPDDSMLKRGATEADSEFYVYDANGERIGRTDREVWNWTIRDAAGRAVREYESAYYPSNSVWLWVEDRFYRDGQPMVVEREAAEGGTWYLHTDHLGSVRVVTNQAGKQISRHVYAPYGTELTSIRQAVARGFDEQSQRFTGHERDFTGGTMVENQNQLDYMHARYYSPALGRFLSVDPVLDVKRATAEPQSWNRYSYVINNPLRYTDPTGKLVANLRDTEAEIKRRKLEEERKKLVTYARVLSDRVKSGQLDSKKAVDIYYAKAVELTKGKKDATMNSLIVATGAAFTIRGTVSNNLTRPSMGQDTLHHYFINATNTYSGVPVWLQSFGANVLLRWEGDTEDRDANNFGAVYGDVLQRYPSTPPSEVMP